MAKTDKMFDWIMHGMIRARNLAKEKGLEELDREIKMRGLLKVPVTIPQSKVDEWAEVVKKNLYDNMLTATLFALHEEFGFGKERLVRFKNRYDQLALQAIDLDWLGNHYVTITDYAKELNERYDMNLDFDGIKENMESYDMTVDMSGRCKIDKVISSLEQNGFENAAEFLKTKLG